jgi:hypothetical protein
MNAYYRQFRRRYSYGWSRPAHGPGLPAGAAVAAGAAILLASAAAHHADGHHAARPSVAAAIAPPAGSSSSANSNERLGMSMAAHRGWARGQAKCLNLLWTRESGWRLVWNYQGSGAFGIPQALPPQKMASAGADYMTNPVTEIKWGLGYITRSYGTPCKAWAHEESDGWY